MGSAGAAEEIDPTTGDPWRGCECCCDSMTAHYDALEQERAYWARYFGQDYGTREEKRRRLEAMRPAGFHPELENL